MSRAVAPAPPADNAPGPLEMFASLPTPVVVLDPDDRIRAINLAAETFLNGSQTALAGKDWTALLPSDSPITSIVGEARAMGGAYAAYDLEIAFITGARHRADVLIAPIGDGAGWLTLSFQLRSVASMVDRQMVHQGAARSAVGVAALLAHEIKNPLSGIRGAAQLLANADTGELTTLICEEVDRIAKLVDRMESFTDTRPLDRSAQNIHAILSHVRRVAEQGFARGLKFTERYDPSLPPISGNRDALVQVFLNLIKNAAEALGEHGGEITLTTAFRHGLRVAVPGSTRRVSVPLEVCVIDNGPGVPLDVADHLFDPFVTSKRSGGGLGLALVAKIVGEHGGLIEYDHSAAPMRTIFRVLLPVHEGK